MSEERVEIELRRSVWPGVLLLLGGILCGAGWYCGERHAVMFGAPLVIFGLFWRRKPRVYTLEFSPTGLQVSMQPPLSSAALPASEIPYAEIEDVWGWRKTFFRPSRFPMAVLHRKGSFWIPPARDPTSAVLYERILSRIPNSGSRVVSAALRPYLDTQVASFGEERVWSYIACTGLSAARFPSWMIGRLSVMAFLCVLTAAAGFASDQVPLISIGISLLIVTGLLWIMRGFSPSVTTHVKDWRSSSLVISPLGLALAQGDLTGQLRWEEVLSVNLRKNKAGSLVCTRFDGNVLRLKIAGSQVLIHDIYDRPLSVIQRQVETYWRQPPKA